MAEPLGRIPTCIGHLGVIWHPCHHPGWLPPTQVTVEMCCLCLEPP